jgi:hypothetical protein
MVCLIFFLYGPSPFPSMPGTVGPVENVGRWDAQNKDLLRQPTRLSYDGGKSAVCAYKSRRPTDSRLLTIVWLDHHVGPVGPAGPVIVL